MRILIASSTYAPATNGQAVFTTNLAEGLAKLGHQVMVVLDSHNIRPASTSINGVLVEELSSISLNYFHKGVFFSPFPGRDIQRLFNEFQPEIVHIQDHYPSCRMVVKVARKRGIRIVGSNHFIPENLTPYIPGSMILKPVLNWMLWQWMLSVYRHADVITAQSKAAAEIIGHRKLKAPIIPISCGIDLHTYFPDPNTDRAGYRQRYGINPQKKVFLFFGRIDRDKRIDLLLHAVQKLSREDIQLVIAGHGHEVESLKRLANKLDLKERVRFTGFIPEPDVPGLMNSVDIFVMPSEAELLSISTLEAMACGKPVILVNTLALPELVREGHNGYLFKPGDAGDLARLMNHLADHPELWPAMGKVSREITTAHSLDLAIQKYQTIYLKLTGAVTVPDNTQQIKEPV
ncbi:MAG TPA: glycosyltransferase [Anaerolineales bacterium]